MPDPRRRPPPPAWTRPILERLTPPVRNVIIALTLAYFFFVLVPASNPWIAAHLFVGPGLFHGEIWQPVTGLFFQARFSGWFFALIGLWWVGAFVERTRGPRFFLGLFFGAGALGNALAGVVSLLLSGGELRSDGPAFALSAIFVAFARLYGARPAQIWGAFAMRADYFTWIIIGFSLVVALFNRDWGGFVAELAAIGVALAATGGIGDLQRLLRGGRSGRPGNRGRYRVIDGGRRTPPPSVLN